MLHNAHAPSGDEAAIRTLIYELAKPYADEIKTDVMGNLVVHRCGRGPRLMLCAHMDSIGLVVTHITQEGFLRCGRLGSLAPENALNTQVRFKNGTCGILVKEEKAKLEKLKLDDCYIDIGANSREDAQRLVDIGDTAVYDTQMRCVGRRVISPYMDNHISCAILLCALQQRIETLNDTYFVFSAQEEVGLRGAKTAAYAIRPEYGVAIDVTDTGDVLGGELLGSAKLGGGAGIKVMDRSIIAHPQMVALLDRLARERDIRTQRDIIEAGGTDAGMIHLSGAGVVTGGISVPCRYIHSPAEMIDLDDAEMCARLTSALIGSHLQ